MHKKLINGIITKKSGINSYTIEVEIPQKIKKYKINIIKKIKVMIDSKIDLDIGERVFAVQCAPISKRKCYKLCYKENQK